MKSFSKKAALVSQKAQGLKRGAKKRVSQILKSAYLSQFQDKYTRLAVKHCLG